MENNGYTAITNLADLKAMGNNLDGNYYLDADIIITDANWTPIGSSANVTEYFRGTLDGQGYTISGLAITGSGKYNGLFGYVSGATIKNLGLVGVDIDVSSSTITTYTGALAGYATATTEALNTNPKPTSALTIENCYATGSVKAESADTAFAGGLVGYLEARVIGNGAEGNPSLGDATVLLDYGANWVAVEASGTKVGENSAGTARAGGLAGYASATTDGNYSQPDVALTIDHSINAGAIKAFSGASGQNGVLAGGLVAYAWYGWSGSGGFPSGSNPTYALTFKNSSNSGDVSVGNPDSLGTNNIRFSAGGIIGAIAHGATISSTTYTADIEVSKCTNSGTVDASYDKGDKVNSTGVYAGGIVGSSDFEDPRTNISISECRNDGAVRGSSDYGVHAGGIAGRVRDVKIADCINTGDVSGDSTSASNSANAGGIAGTAYATAATVDISGCENEGAVSVTGQYSYNYAGGICGDPGNTPVSNSENRGAVSASVIGTATAVAGGIVARFTGNSYAGETAPLLNCINKGAVESTHYAGGICAQFGGDYNKPDFDCLVGCTNEGTVSVEGLGGTGSSGSTYTVYAGGLIAECTAGVIIRDSHNTATGAVSATGKYIDSYGTNVYAGGLVAYVNTGNLTVSASSNAGAVTASGPSSASAYAGGILGRGQESTGSGGNITISASENKATGSISATSGRNASAGGIGGNVQSPNTTISNCTNKGSVSGTSSTQYAYVGGIAGNTNTWDYGNSITISGCSNEGEVSGTAGGYSSSSAAYIGGIAGNAGGYTLIENCENAE
ncbi:MAG: hypothetical protein LBI54_06265, partial [Lachnospiraceae bacterium]|nr:hypothetical protein [Lachnospiraceae bacterium]